MLYNIQCQILPKSSTPNRFGQKGDLLSTRNTNTLQTTKQKSHDKYYDIFSLKAKKALFLLTDYIVSYHVMQYYCGYYKLEYL